LLKEHLQKQRKFRFQRSGAYQPPESAKQSGGFTRPTAHSVLARKGLDMEIAGGWTSGIGCALNAIVINDLNPSPS
jgi:hypothetical protein